MKVLRFNAEQSAALRARAEHRAKPVMRRAIEAAAAWHRRQLVAAAAAGHDHTCSWCKPAPGPDLPRRESGPEALTLTPEQQTVLASAAEQVQRVLLREDIEDARATLRRCADQLADRVDPNIRRRRELWLRVHGAGRG